MITSFSVEAFANALNRMQQDMEKGKKVGDRLAITEQEEKKYQKKKSKKK